MPIRFNAPHPTFFTWDQKIRKVSEMNRKWLSIALIIAVLVLLIGIVPASASPSEADTVHIVQRGETLSAIAVRYGVNMWTIASVNGITNPNRIYVGQRLVIPTSTAAASGNIHVVQRGETMTSIGLRYGVDPWAIARANNITNLNYIYVGQRLIIPGTGASTAPPSQPAQPSQPATFPGPWTGEYFGNVSLTPPPYLTRQDEAINFNWGWGPPAGGMPTNNFSIRWTGTFHFSEGTYRFYAKADDGVRVFIDGIGVINGWRDGGLRTYTADVGLAAGNHTVVVEYYERTQVAIVQFWYRQLSGAKPTPTPTPIPGEPPAAPTTSWFGEYYNGEGLSGEPVATRYDPWIGFDWGTGSPMPEVWLDHFSIRWTSKVRLDTANYRFCAMTDDGVRLWVGNNLLINEWHGNNGVTYCSPYAAGYGDHTVRIEYYEHQGNALIYVWWEKE
jgi:LysM repeat protein